MDKESVTLWASLIASVIALSGSLLALFISSSLAIRKERRQLLWSKELDRFFELEESVGILVEDLGSYKSIQDREEWLLGQLDQLDKAAGKFARYHGVRQAIRDLHNILGRLYVAKRDHEDGRDTRGEIEQAYRKFLKECDGIVNR